MCRLGFRDGYFHCVRNFDILYMAAVWLSPALILLVLQLLFNYMAACFLILFKICLIIIAVVVF